MYMYMTYMGCSNVAVMAGWNCFYFRTIQTYFDCTYDATSARCGNDTANWLAEFDLRSNQHALEFYSCSVAHPDGRDDVTESGVTAPTAFSKNSS